MLSLPAELQQFVAQEIASGQYQSTDELLGEAVRLLRERKRHELRRQLQLGLDQLESGEAFDLADNASLAAFFDEIEAEVQREMAVVHR